MNLSEHLTLDQFTRSQTATRLNIQEQFNPPAELIKFGKDWAENVYEKLLLLFPDIFISSGYRCDKLNKAIGGASSSQHCLMQAGDLESPKSKSNMEIAKAVLSAKIPFDQMIIEFGTMEKPAWIHVSYKSGGNRFQILRAEVKDGKTAYSVQVEVLENNGTILTVKVVKTGETKKLMASVANLQDEPFQKAPKAKKQPVRELTADEIAHLASFDSMSIIRKSRDNYRSGKSGLSSLTK